VSNDPGRQSAGCQFLFQPGCKDLFFSSQYQREYVWGLKNWDAYINDLDESPIGHFLGSIICVNTQQDGTAGGRLELIDGQQRFTRSVLLFCAFYRKLQAIENCDRKLMVELATLKIESLYAQLASGVSKPSDAGQNKTDFQKVLSDLFPKQISNPKVWPTSAIANRQGLRLLLRALEFAEPGRNAFDTREAQSSDAREIEVRSHSTHLCCLSRSTIEGIPLSAIDIIKNNLLAELDRRAEYGIDRAFDEWKDLIDLLPDPAVQERFLRQLYNIFKYLKRVEVKGCARATRSNLITIYDTCCASGRCGYFVRCKPEAGRNSTLLTPSVAKDRWGEAHSSRIAGSTAPRRCARLRALAMGERGRTEPGLERG